MYLLIISIVAVHGLNPMNADDHADTTWKDPRSGNLWLQDEFPKKQPAARMLLYSYNSSPVFGASKISFVAQVNDLLERLIVYREDVGLSLLILDQH